MRPDLATEAAPAHRLLDREGARSYIPAQPLALIIGEC